MKHHEQDSNLQAVSDMGLCCGGGIRTPGLQVMSLTSYHCSTPLYKWVFHPMWHDFYLRLNIIHIDEHLLVSLLFIHLWSGQDLNLRPTDYESGATNQLSYRTKSTSLRTVTNLQCTRFSVRLVVPIQIPNLQLFFGTMNIQPRIFLPYSV